MVRLKGKRAVLFLLGFISTLFLMANISFLAKITRDYNSDSSSKDSGSGWTELQTPLQRYVSHLKLHSLKFQCGSLFGQDEKELTEAQEYLEDRNYTFSPFSVKMFTKVTQDCETFKSTLGYYRTYSQTEMEFPLAFSILTYDKIEELERLLRMIYAPQNIYCIHVDLKASSVFLHSVQLLTKCFPNVYVATRLESVVYEHFSRLRADLNCIEDLMFYGRSWKYLLNFASSEIPLKTNLEMVNILKSLNGSNDIREVYRNRRLERFLYRYYLLSDGTLQKTDELLSPPPHNLTITKGLAYGAFSRQFLEFAMTNQIARDFLEWTKDTHSPDEHYWATLNNLYHNPFLNTPGGAEVHPDRNKFISRFVIWKSNGGRHTCHGKYRHNICIFGLGDLPSLKISRKLVANKFDVLYDPVTYSCMEEHLRNKTLYESETINRRYY